MYSKEVPCKKFKCGSLSAKILKQLGWSSSTTTKCRRVFTANDSFLLPAIYLSVSLFLDMWCNLLVSCRSFRVADWQTVLGAKPKQLPPGRHWTNWVAQPHGPVQRKQRQWQHKCPVNKAAGRSGRSWGSDMLTVSQRAHEPDSSGLCSTAMATHTHRSAEAFEPGQGSQRSCCSQCPWAESNTKTWVFLALHHRTDQAGLLQAAAQLPATSRQSRPILSETIPHLCYPFHWKFLWWVSPVFSMSQTTRQSQGQGEKSVHTLVSGLTRPIVGTAVADPPTATHPTLHSQRLKAHGQA